MKFTETQEMSRAYEEEGEIYANEDMIYDDVRTGTEDSDAKRLQCTGIHTHLIIIVNRNTHREHVQIVS